MKSKKSKCKAVAAALTFGMLWAGGGCVPQNFWADLAGGLIASAADFILIEAVDSALNPALTE